MLKDNLYAELMEDLHPNRPRVEILGDSRVIVENKRGIQLTALSMDELAVIGVISSVEYITTE